MRLSLIQTNAIVIPLLVICSSGFAQSQRCPPDTICDPLKFDEYWKLSWSDEKARLNNVAESLKKLDADYGAFFFVYAGRVACVGEARSRATRAKNYLVARGIKPKRVVWFDAGYRDEGALEVWFLPLEMKSPYLQPGIDRRQVRLKHCAKRTSIHRRRA